MPSSTATLPQVPSARRAREEPVVELGRLLESGWASRRDVARAATALPGFVDLLVAQVDALHRGANWQPGADSALARLGFRRTAELLEEFLTGRA
ncbi:hypothetical protein [Engelhardtia mirabilis]